MRRSVPKKVKKVIDEGLTELMQMPILAVLCLNVIIIFRLTTRNRKELLIRFDFHALCFLYRVLNRRPMR
jgi:hypothetical protein